MKQELPTLVQVLLQVLWLSLGCGAGVPLTIDIQLSLRVFTVLAVGRTTDLILINPVLQTKPFSPPSLHDSLHVCKALLIA